MNGLAEGNRIPLAWVLLAGLVAIAIACGGSDSSPPRCTVEPTGRPATPEELASASEEDLSPMILAPDELGPEFMGYEMTDTALLDEFLSPVDETALGFVKVHVATYSETGSTSSESLSNAVALFESDEGASAYLPIALDQFFLRSITTPEEFSVEDTGDEALAATALAGTGERGTVVVFRLGRLIGLVAAVGSADKDVQKDVAAVACGLAVRMDEVLSGKPAPEQMATVEPPTPQP